MKRKAEYSRNGSRKGRHPCNYHIWIAVNSYSPVEYCVKCGARRVIIKEVRNGPNDPC